MYDVTHDRYAVTHDMYAVTCDRYDVTCDMYVVTCVRRAGDSWAEKLLLGDSDPWVDRPAVYIGEHSH